MSQSKPTEKIVLGLFCLAIGAVGGVLGNKFLSEGGFGEKKDPVVAKYDGKTLTASDAFKSIQSRVTELEEEIYRTKTQAINGIIEEQLLASESKKQSLSIAQLLEKETGGEVGDVSNEEVENFLTSKGLSLDDPRIRKDDVKDYIKYSRKAAKKQSYVDKLKEQANVKVLIDAPKTPTFAVETEGYPTWGNANAPVTLVEFSDFQCPFCSKALPTLKQIKEAYGPDKVKIVFRDLPLPSHGRAKPAAMAAHCANDQGKFWEFHDRLFENQDALSDEDLKNHAEALELDTEAFASCMETNKHEALVEKSRRDAEAMGISATPSFLVNGHLIKGAQDFSRFKEKIDQALSPKS